MKRFLLIAHYFPPAGGAGVQRSVKFVRYLPTYGVIPIVLTASARGEARWAPPDPSLASEVPPDVPVVRIDQPNAAGDSDARNEAYFNVGIDLIREYRPEVIMVTMSPFGHAEIASRLSQRTGIPWIADLRDPWALDEFQVYPSRWHRYREIRRMGHALLSASLIIMNTPEAAKRVRQCLPELAKIPVTVLTNGFDSADFCDHVPPPDDDVFRIVHTGSLHSDVGLQQRRRWLEYRLLGRVQPGVRLLGRSHFYLIRALEKWVRFDRSVRDRVRLVLLGSLTQTDRDIVTSSEVADMVETPGYVSHAESLAAIRKADLLFLPMHSVAHGQRATIVPGKTYEYIASGRPILGAVPAGDARDYLYTSGTAELCDPEDVSAMVRILRRQHQEARHAAPTVPSREWLRQFERAELTRKLAGLLKRHFFTG